MIKPKLNAEQSGRDLPMQVHHDGDFKPITDDADHCSASRWHPQMRNIDTIAERLLNVL